MNRTGLRYFFLTITLVLLESFKTAAQTNEQLWFEYMLNLPFSNSFNFEQSVTYSTVLDRPKWRAIDYNPTLEYSISPNFDLLGSGLISYTAQTDSYNTFEFRPMLGTRIFFTPHQRIQTRLLLRFEQRNFLNLETKEWSHVMRPRIRGEVAIPINQDSYFKDNLWYGIVDAEWMFVDNDVEERFANRFRLRMGIGYRLNYSFRFEFIYMNQQSKDGITETFHSSDNIFRLRFKHFLRKSKPTKSSGVGN